MYPGRHIDDVFYIHHDFIEDKGLEMEYFEKAYKGKDIRGSGFIESNMFLFYPYFVDSRGKTVPISEEILKTKAPNTYEYLLSKKEDLLKREYFAKSNKLWYELWNPRKKQHFYNRKFVFSEIGLFNDFVLVDKCFYTDSACGAELIKEYEKYYQYLLLYLNSDVATYVYKKVSVPKANGYSIYKNAFLKQMPIVFPCDEEDVSIFEGMSQIEFNNYLYKRLKLSDYEIIQIANMISTLRGN